VDQGLFRADDIHATLGEILAGQRRTAERATTRSRCSTPPASRSKIS
jgi:hypothetical protein